MPRAKNNVIPSVLDEVKEQLQLRLGRTVLSTTDCLLLGQEIEKNTGNRLSLNTIRRVFGLIQTSNLPTQKTLDILAEYCGFNGFNHFQISRQSPYIKFHGLSFDSVNSLYRKSVDDDSYFQLLNWTVVLAFQQKNYDFLKNIFKLEVFNQDVQYNQHTPKFLDMMLTLGLEMRKYPQMQALLWKEFAKDPVSQFIYFEHFVDHDFLAINHHKAIHEYALHKQEPEAKLFSNCLLFLKGFLVNNFAECKTYIKRVNQIQIDPTIHPYPLSRMLSYNLLYQRFSTNHIDQGWIDYIFDIESKIPITGSLNRNVPIFHMIVSEALVWCGKYDEAKALIEKAFESYPYLNDVSIFGNAAANAKLKTYYAKCLFENNEIESAIFVFDSILPEHFDIQSRQFDLMHYYNVGSELKAKSDGRQSLNYKRHVSELYTAFGFDFFASVYSKK